MTREQYASLPLSELKERLEGHFYYEKRGSDSADAG